MAGKRKKRSFKSSKPKSKRSKVNDAVFGSKKMFVARNVGNAMAITERKYFDTVLGSTGISTADADWTGSEYDPTASPANTLFAPPRGTDINQREGRRVQVLKIQIRGTIYAPAETGQTVANTYAKIRLILYQDMQTNGTQSQAEDLISAGTNDAVDMFQNTANFGRFRVLKDRLFSMDDTMMILYAAGDIKVSGRHKPFKWTVYFKKPVIVHFNAADTANGSVADIVDHSWHIIAKCQSTTVTPSILYRARTTYIDV